MAIEPVTSYIAICDTCGFDAGSCDNCVTATDRVGAAEAAIEHGWTATPYGPAQCPDCIEASGPAVVVDPLQARLDGI